MRSPLTEEGYRRRKSNRIQRGARPSSWLAFIHFAPGATIPPPSGWTTWSPSPTTRFRRPCSRPTTSAAPTTWCGLSLACLNFSMPSAAKASIRARRGISAPGASRACWSRRRIRASLPMRSASRFPAPSVVKERRGFIALGKLHEYAEQVVFRHEQTLSKPKSDRLNLLKATRAHFGQIFMLYSDPAGSVEKILYDGNGTAEAEVTDEYGVLHRLWRVSDPAAIRLLTTAMADKKLIIADGHHRYETALNYSKEHAPACARRKAEHSANQLPQPAYPEAAVMMTFVNMDPDGLVILPTHRVVHSLAGFDPAAFCAAAEEFFTVEALLPAEAAGRDRRR